MPSIYYCQFLGDDGWSAWRGGYQLPPFPKGFDEEHCHVSLASREGEDWCYVYEPEKELVTWCVWDGDTWSDWVGAVQLAPPPNFLVDDELGVEEAFFSVSSHGAGEWMVAYNPADGSVYWSPWAGDGYGAWEGPEEVDDPPNLGDETDVFCAGDGENEWLISINTEDWSVQFATFEEGEYSEWSAAPELPIPEEWRELGLDLDGAGRDGQFWIYATVYDDEFH